jgi:hypothetical protein
MTADELEGHLGRPVTIDLCGTCQLIWFDDHESLQLSPGAVLKLFRLIGEQGTAARSTDVGRPSCPRCAIRLLETHDQQRRTRFEYRRCPKGHGRLITFVDFLKEKDFIRPLSAEQIARLKQNVQVVNCSNCGAPIDLTRGSSCEHCHSPLSMLDMTQAGDLVATLQEAERPRPIDPSLPLQLEHARREVDAAFASFEQRPGWFAEVSEGGLVSAGLNALARWLKQRG